MQNTNISNFVLLGDFNVKFSNPLHPLFSNLCTILDSFSLVQVVLDPTHTSPLGTSSLIDLVLMSNPSMFSACMVIPPLEEDEEVHDLLLSLDIIKANVPDGISATMLKATATSIANSGGYRGFHIK